MFLPSFVATLPDPIRAEEIQSWRHQWVYFLTNCRDVGLRDDLFRFRSAIEWNPARHLPDPPGRHNFVLYRHAACESIESHAVQQI